MRFSVSYPFSNIEFSGDVTFDEDDALGKARDSPVPASTGRRDDTMDVHAEPYILEPNLPDEPMTPLDPLDPSPCDSSSSRKRPLWLRDTLQDTKKPSALKGTFRESKKPCRYQGYVALMSNIIQSEPGCYEEAVKEQVWRDAMTEEYQSIMKNVVCQVVSRPEGKSIVTSKWILKIKHVADGSIENFKARFMARGFSQKEGEDYDVIFALVAQYTTIRSIIVVVAN
eukprot:PITA_33470